MKCTTIEKLFIWFIIVSFTSVSLTTIKTQSSYASGCQGCCSWHKGITDKCNSATNKIICADGEDSPSCGCSCLNSSIVPHINTSGGSSGGGGGGVNSAAIAGSIFGIAFASFAIFAATRDADKDDYNRHYNRAIKNGNSMSTFEHLNTGKYVLTKSNCNTSIPESEIYPLIDIKQQLAQKKTKTQSEKAILSQLKKISVESNQYFISSEFSNSPYLGKILDDGTIMIFDINSAIVDGSIFGAPLCIGDIPKKALFKRINLHCYLDDKYCHTSYLHYTATKEYKRMEREQKKKSKRE